jgi:uncharacterized protein with NAD-binding domain and iron-sulfur cluster
MPKEHITFMQSEFDVSCIDLSQLWRTGDATAINAVATDVKRLSGLSEEYVQKQIVDEVLKYLGQQATDVASVEYNSNANAPLFLNEVGSWHDRPEAATALPDIVVAGDYVRNSFGIASVEGAIVSAKQATTRLAEYFDISIRPNILYPREVSNDQIASRLRMLEPVKAWALAQLAVSRPDASAPSKVFE